MMKRALAVLAPLCLGLLVLLSLLTASCSWGPGYPQPTDRPTTPAPRPCLSLAAMPKVQVPVNIIRVLHQPEGFGAGDAPGAANNLGCRASEGRIDLAMWAAATFYGNKLNVRLAFEESEGSDPFVRDLRLDLEFWGGYPYGEVRTRRGYNEIGTMNYFIWGELYNSRIQPGKYRTDCVNVFFTGNIAALNEFGSPIPGKTVYGATLDPAGVWAEPGKRKRTANPFSGTSQALDPFIFINDNFGNVNYVIEHELGHWFLRYPARYGSSEHAPEGSNLLMAAGGVLSLELQDDPSQGYCESEEMYRQAQWWRCADNQGNGCCE